jgi:type IV secretion system protein TrbL
MSSHHVLAIDLNPLHWLGDAASSTAGNLWKSAMTGLWSAALWCIKTAFQLIDSFTNPDLSAGGPMRDVLPTTLWIGATLAAIMIFVQLTLALVRRDGESMGRIFLGIGQFGLVWVGYLGMAAGMVAAAAGLSKGILSSMLHVHSMHEYNFDAAWPHSVDDITLATVLGVLSLLLVIPAAFFYILIMLVREAALIILVATAPISAGGLVSDIGKVWFWKTLRWFFACLLISPAAALLLGIGVKLSNGAINHTPPPCAPSNCDNWGWLLNHGKQMSDWQHANNSATAGMAIVGCIVIAIGAVCPLILFRLLAFVEPGTASGAALRQSWADAGGLSGIMSGGKQSAGTSAATHSGSDGRSGGESGAESQTASRLTSALGSAGQLFGAGMQIATSVAHKAADVGSDVLGGAGVGSPGYSMTPTDERVTRNGGYRRSNGGQGGEQAGGEGGGGSAPPPSDPPEPPTPPVPGPAPTPPAGPDGGGAAGGGEAGSAAGGAGGGADAAAVAL